MTRGGRGVLVLAWSLAASACHATTGPPPRHTPPPDRPPTPVVIPTAPAPNLIGPKSVPIRGPIRTRGSAIVDATGRVVRLNGVGVRDFVAVGLPGVPCAGSPPPEEATNIADWGFNSVRIPLAWANLEPDKPTIGVGGALVHRWNTPFLDALDGFVHQITSLGIAVTFTMHLKFGGDTTKSPCNASTVPPWLLAPPISGNDEALRAGCDLLQGVTPPGAAEPMWQGLSAAWSMVVHRYAANAQVIGADMLNEPYPQGPCSPANVRVSELYRQLGGAIRRADPRIALIFEDVAPGQALHGKFELAAPPPFPNVIYSYHLYQPDWIPDGEAVHRAYLDRARSWHVPLLVGEFNAFGYAAPATGYDRNWASDTDQALAIWRREGVGWMAWAYGGGNHLVLSDGQPRADLITAFQKGF
jgi:Cellulase (glycosyl hydrolase family 5)